MGGSSIISLDITILDYFQPGLPEDLSTSTDLKVIHLY